MKQALLAVILCLSLTACPKVPLADTARDTYAALGGAIAAAQTQYQTQCTADPKGQACVIINQAIASQNLLITATETYCGWSVASPPPVGTVCAPVPSAETALRTSISNAQLFITQLKGALK